MSRPPRIALFPDSYLESNGVARTAQAIVAFAARRDLPLLCVHGGQTTRLSSDGARCRLELRRSRVALALEHDLQYDLLFARHYRTVRQAVTRFRPDVLHVTGPNDVGQLGAYVAHRLRIPVVGSWHTNVHQFASRRALERLSWLPAPGRVRVRDWIERGVLAATLQFYRIPRVLLAPNRDLVALLSTRTGKEAHLMLRGIDTLLFAPAWRTRADRTLCIGFVGRLSPEKGVRVLADLERALLADGQRDFRLVVIGDGGERAWLQAHLRHADFSGVLQGEALSRAYADMDLFAFPSETETFGNVVLEAMASGVPVVAMAHGGPRQIIETGVSGVLAADTREFVTAVVGLARDDARRVAMGRAARDQAGRWSWDSICERLYDVYGQAAEQSGTAHETSPEGFEGRAATAGARQP